MRKRTQKVKMMLDTRNPGNTCMYSRTRLVSRLAKSLSKDWLWIPGWAKILERLANRALRNSFTHRVCNCSIDQSEGDILYT